MVFISGAHSLKYDIQNIWGNRLYARPQPSSGQMHSRSEFGAFHKGADTGRLERGWGHIANQVGTRPQKKE